MEIQEQYPFLYIPCYVRDLSPQWEKILHLGESVFLKKNSFFSLGEYKNHFSWIESGLTCCFVREKVGIQDEIRYFVAEKCLIKETFLSAGCLDITTHKCLTDVRLHHFPLGLIYDHDFQKNYPDLLENYIYSISAKSVSAQFFSRIQKQKTNTQKLAIYIYGFYLANNKKLEFMPPLTQNQLASLLGLSKLTINRIIAKLKDQNILAGWTKNRLKIVNIDAIKNLRFSE